MQLLRDLSRSSFKFQTEKENVQLQLKAAFSEHPRQENFRFMVIYLKTLGPDAFLQQ